MSDSEVFKYISQSAFWLGVGMCIGVGFSTTIKAITEYKPTKEQVCLGYYENVNQALYLMNSLDIDPIKQPNFNVKRNLLLDVKEELGDFCSSEDKLDSLVITGKFDCDSFKDAYRILGMTEIPEYIICGETK